MLRGSGINVQAEASKPLSNAWLNFDQKEHPLKQNKKQISGIKNDKIKTSLVELSKVYKTK